MIDGAAALMLLGMWAAVSTTGTVDQTMISSRRAEFVGSLLFQYDPAAQALIARGIVFQDTGVLKDPREVLARLVAYGERHPETVGRARLELATADATGNDNGRIALRLDIVGVPPRDALIGALRDLSKDADLWRRRHVIAALRGE